ncbi:hypothetical protein B7P43_G16466, partial [Cryptotermes secundus]
SNSANKSRIAMAKAAFSKKKNFFTSKLDLNLRKKLVKCYVWSKWKANWIGHILRSNCLLKEVIEGKIEVWIEVDRRGYCHLKEKALDRIKWRNCFRRDCGPVVLADY